jgi:hypothetical protein
MMKTCLILLLIIILVCTASSGSSENVKARENLLEKYRDVKHSYDLLRIVLRHKSDGREEINRFYSALNKLVQSQHPGSQQILIDLLDFYLGEAPAAIIRVAIVNKGKSMLPLLKKKLIDLPIMNESPNEKDPGVILKTRNTEIMRMMELIYYEIPDSISYTELSKTRLTKLKLFLVQKCLEKYFATRGVYPRTLVELSSEECRINSSLEFDGWGNPFMYLSGEGFYFLSSVGADGKSGSGDEIACPIESELHLFP